MRISKNSDAAKKTNKQTSLSRHSSILVKIVCFLAALFVWFYAAGEQSPTTNKQFFGVPVKVEGMVELERQGYTIISGSDAMADVTLTGRRNDLNNYGTGDITVVADLSGIYSPGEYQINLRAMTPDGTTLSKMVPESITVVVDKSSQKQIRVEPVIVSGGVNDPSLRIEELIPSYSTVRVTGPEKELENISKAVVEVSLTGLVDKTCEYVGRLYLVDNMGIRYENRFVSCDKSEIRVTIPVRKYKTVPVEVDFTDKNIDGYAYELDLETESIVISGNADIIDSVSSVKTELVDLSGINGATCLKVKLMLPLGTYTDGDDSVTLSIFPKSGTKKDVATSNICLINVENGIKATIVDSTVNISFVGTANNLSALNSRTVYAVADLSGYTMKGTYEVRLDVVYPDGLDVKLSKDAYCKIVIDRQ